MKTALRLLPLALAALASVATSAPVDPPEPEVCDQVPGAPTIEGLELGKPYTAEWTPFVDGETAAFEIGGQGSPMLVVRLLVLGDGAPACLGQSTVMHNAAGEVLAEEVRAIETHELAPGMRATDEIYLPLFFSPQSGELFTVTTSAGNMSTTVTLVAE
jgi:hypothetical protein